MYLLLSYYGVSSVYKNNLVLVWKGLNNIGVNLGGNQLLNQVGL